QAKRRIRKELVAIEREPVDGISLGLVGDDLLEMQATITGPVDSPYEGGIFNIHICVPGSYPLNPPKFTFVTRIFHPNIDAHGNISCNLLSSHWCHALTIDKLLLCIQSQLDDPFGDDRNNPDVECLVPQVAEVYWESREVYEQCVRRWVEKYAM
ncbi:ubiquitin-conjugating enzyme/RWD-like protein, partial [Paraphoma chrysanthemicola]